MSLFRPPIVRSATAALDRSLFSKTIPLAAARVPNVKNISRFQVELNKSHELLTLDRLRPVRIDPDPALASKGGKCLLLKPEIKPDDSSTWSQVLQEASEKNEIDVIPYNLTLDYDYWQYRTYVEKLEFQRRCSDRNS
jgi:tRNA (guanine37-N1)-methyltransferase